MAVLDPLQTFWTIKGPSGRIITCAAYRAPRSGPVEIRVGYNFDTTLVLELASDMVLARQRAGQMLETP